MEWLCLALQLHWASHPPGVAGAAVLQCCRLHMSAAGPFIVAAPGHSLCGTALKLHSFIVLHWSRK